MAEIIDEKRILKEAENREKEAKIVAKKKKIEKKTEEKVKKAEKVVSKVVHRERKRSKRYKLLKESIDRNTEFTIDEAIKMVCDIKKPSFDPTIELHLRLDKKVENLRGVVKFPAGTPKTKIVLEVSDNNIEDVIKSVKSGKTEFDVIVATPSVMPKLSVLAKALGPKGLMPSPKNGTISENTKEVAEDFKSGKVEFKVDKGNNLHFGIAKISFGEERIRQNIDAVLSAVPVTKVLSAHINPTMGPSVRIKTGK